MRTPEELMSWLSANVSDPVLQMAMEDGRVELLGGFDPVPGKPEEPGWMVRVRNRSRTYYLAVTAHTKQWRRCKNVPWKNWTGGITRLYTGQNPRIYAMRREQNRREETQGDTRKDHTQRSAVGDHAPDRETGASGQDTPVDQGAKAEGIQAPEVVHDLHHETGREGLREGAHVFETPQQRSILAISKSHQVFNHPRPILWNNAGRWNWLNLEMVEENIRVYQLGAKSGRTFGDIDGHMVLPETIFEPVPQDVARIIVQYVGK